MRIEQFLLGLLFGGLVLFIGLASLTSLINEYDVQDADTSKFAGIYEKFNATTVRGVQNKDLEDNILGEGVTEDSVEDRMFKGGFQTAKDLYDSTDLFGEATSIVVKEVALADEYTPGLFPTIGNTIVIAVGILLGVSILYLVFRFMPR